MHRLLTALPVLALMTGPAFADETFFLSVGHIDGKTPEGVRAEAEFGTIFRSTDGRAWENVFKGGMVKSGFSHSNCNLMRCVAYGNGTFIATGSATNVYRSTDGRKWVPVPDQKGGMCVGFGNNQFVVPTALHFRVSRDGRNWTGQPMEPRLKGAGPIRKIIFGNGTFVCMGETFLGVTRDCKKWDHHEMVDTKRHQVVFGAGRFLWLREGQAPQVSTDALKWQPLPLPQGQVVRRGPSNCQMGALWTGSEFILTTSNGYLRSPDGVEWGTWRAVKPHLLLAAGKGCWMDNHDVSTDEGKTWRKLEGLGARKIYFFNGREIIGSSGS